ncbi:MAG: hypothetical protein GYB68_10670 [Chloroflexi bacterium]|nr:hypothetical protein [Chloroflexota bacterium]
MPNSRRRRDVLNEFTEAWLSGNAARTRALRSAAGSRSETLGLMSLAADLGESLPQIEPPERFIDDLRKRLLASYTSPEPIAESPPRLTVGRVSGALAVVLSTVAVAVLITRLLSHGGKPMPPVNPEKRGAAPA